MRKNMQASEIAYELFVKGDPESEAILEEERRKLKLTAELRSLRENAGLTQAELARLVGTTPSAVAELEDPDCVNHSIEALQRAVSALGMELEFKIVRKSAKKRPSRAAVSV